MERAVVQARWRFAALCISQAAHFFSNYSLRVFVVLVYAGQGGSRRDTAWHIVAAIFMLPSIFLVPLYGAASNAMPKHRALVGSAAYCLLIMAFFTWWERGWLACVAAYALGSALYAPTRMAMLPAAAQDTQIPLPRVVGTVETFSVLSIVSGMAMGGALMPVTWEPIGHALGLPQDWTLSLQASPLSVVQAAVLASLMLSLALALPSRFQSDVHRAESALQAIRSFFKDALRALKQRETCTSLLAVCQLRGVVAASVGALIASALANAKGEDAAYKALILIAVLTMVGNAAGSGFAALFARGSWAAQLMTVSSAGLCATFAVIALHPPAPAWLCMLAGFFSGLLNVPLLSRCQASLPSDMLGNGMALLNTAGLLAMTLTSLLLAGLAGLKLIDTTGQLWAVTLLSLPGILLAWRMLAATGLRMTSPEREGGELRNSSTAEQQNSRT